jgi:hypothetical protein
MSMILFKVSLLSALCQINRNSLRLVREIVNCQSSSVMNINISIAIDIVDKYTLSL